jgi:hypothetical protein
MPGMNPYTERENGDHSESMTSQLASCTEQHTLYWGTPNLEKLLGLETNCVYLLF